MSKSKLTVAEKRAAIHHVIRLEAKLSPGDMNDWLEGVFHNTGPTSVATARRLLELLADELTGKQLDTFHRMALDQEHYLTKHDAEGECTDGTCDRLDAEQLARRDQLEQAQRLRLAEQSAATRAEVTLAQSAPAPGLAKVIDLMMAMRGVS
jgi:hypothetical protein